MNLKNGSLYIVSMLLILFLSIAMVSASEIGTDDTLIDDVSGDSDLIVSDVSGDSDLIVDDVSDDTLVSDSSNDLIKNDTLSNDLSPVSDVDEVKKLEKLSYRSSSLSDKESIYLDTSSIYNHPVISDSFGFRLMDDSTAPISADLDIYFNDEYFTTIKTVDDWDYTYVSLSDLKLGDNNLTVKYNGSDFYDSLEEFYVFTLYEQHSYIIYDSNIDMALGSSDVFNFTLKEDYDSEKLEMDYNLTVSKVDDDYNFETIKEFSLNGNDSLLIDDSIITSVGVYNIKMVFSGSEDYKYAPYDENFYFYVYNVCPKIVIDAPDFVIPNKDVEITVSLIDSNSGNALDDKEFKVIIYYDEGGDEFYHLYDETVKGSKTYLIPYDVIKKISPYDDYLHVSASSDEENYNYASAEYYTLVSLEDGRKETSISHYIDDNVIGKELEFCIRLYDEDSYGLLVENLDIYLNDEFLTTITTTSDDDNPFTMVLKDLQKGDNNLRISFNGTDDYKGLIYDHDFVVCDIESTIMWDYNDILIGETFNLKANLTEVKSGELINKTVEYWISTEDGVTVKEGNFTSNASISISDLPLGEYAFYFAFVDEDYVILHAMKNHISMFILKIQVFLLEDIHLLI